MTTTIDACSPFIEGTLPYEYTRKTAGWHFKLYTKAYNKLFNTSFSQKELKTIMKQWDSVTDNSLAKMYTDTLNDELGGFSQRVITSAGFVQGFKNGIDGNPSASHTELGGDTNLEILRLVQQYLTEYASYAKNETVQEQLQKMGKIGAMDTLSHLPEQASDVTIWTKQSLELLKKSTDKSLRTLGEIMAQLTNLSGKSVTVGEKTYVSPWKVVGAISGILNKVGGEKIGEPAAVAIGQSISAEMSKRLGPEGLKKYLSNDSNVKVNIRWDAAMTAKDANAGALNGKEIKPDYEIEYHIEKGGQGVFSIILPVSMKIKRSNAFLGLTKNQNKKGKINFGTPMTFLSALEMLGQQEEKAKLETRWYAVYHRENSKKGRSGTQWDPTEESEYTEDNIGWQNLLTDIKIQVAKRSILGSLGLYKMSDGSIGKDIVAIVEINDKFIPASKIIQSLTNNPELIDIVKGKALWHDFRKQVALKTVQKAGRQKRGESGPEEAKARRIAETKKRIEKTYSQKIAVEVNTLGF